MKRVDTDGDGEISKDEFRDFADKQYDKLGAIFSKLDNKGTGRLRAKDVGEAL